MWGCSSEGFDRCTVEWNKTIRRVLHVPYRIHRWLLGPLSGHANITEQLHIKSLRLIDNSINHDNPTRWRRQGGVPGVLAPLGQAPHTRKKLICTRKNGGTSAVSLVTGFFKADVGLRRPTCLDDPLRPLTIGLGDKEEIRRK